MATDRWGDCGTVGVGGGGGEERKGGKKNKAVYLGHFGSNSKGVFGRTINPSLLRIYQEGHRQGTYRIPVPKRDATKRGGGVRSKRGKGTTVSVQKRNQEVSPVTALIRIGRIRKGSEGERRRLRRSSKKKKHIIKYKIVAGARTIPGHAISECTGERT